MTDTAPLTVKEQLDLSNMLLHLKAPVELVCNYKNWKGETSERRLRPIAFWHGSTEWHPEPGLMMKAVDLEKQAERDFRVADFDLATLRVA